jgi:hypothetical protein
MLWGGVATVDGLQGSAGGKLGGRDELPVLADSVISQADLA